MVYKRYDHRKMAFLHRERAEKNDKNSEDDDDDLLDHSRQPRKSIMVPKKSNQPRKSIHPGKKSILPRKSIDVGMRRKSLNRCDSALSVKFAVNVEYGEGRRGSRRRQSLAYQNSLDDMDDMVMAPVDMDDVHGELDVLDDLMMQLEEKQTSRERNKMSEELFEIKDRLSELLSEYDSDSGKDSDGAKLEQSDSDTDDFQDQSQVKRTIELLIDSFSNACNEREEILSRRFSIDADDDGFEQSSDSLESERESSPISSGGLVDELATQLKTIVRELNRKKAKLQKFHQRFQYLVQNGDCTGSSPQVSMKLQKKVIDQFKSVSKRKNDQKEKVDTWKYAANEIVDLLKSVRGEGSANFDDLEAQFVTMVDAHNALNEMLTSKNEMVESQKTIIQNIVKECEALKCDNMLMQDQLDLCRTNLKSAQQQTMVLEQKLVIASKKAEMTVGKRRADKSEEEQTNAQNKENEYLLKEADTRIKDLAQQLEDVTMEFKNFRAELEIEESNTSLSPNSSKTESDSFDKKTFNSSKDATEIGTAPKHCIKCTAKDARCKKLMADAQATKKERDTLLEEINSLRTVVFENNQTARASQESTNEPSEQTGVTLVVSTVTTTSSQKSTQNIAIPVHDRRDSTTNTEAQQSTVKRPINFESVDAQIQVSSPCSCGGDGGELKKRGSAKTATANWNLIAKDVNEPLPDLANSMNSHFSDMKSKIGGFMKLVGITIKNGPGASRSVLPSIKQDSQTGVNVSGSQETGGTTDQQQLHVKEQNRTVRSGHVIRATTRMRGRKTSDVVPGFFQSPVGESSAPPAPVSSPAESEPVPPGVVVEESEEAVHTNWVESGFFDKEAPNTKIDVQKKKQETISIGRGRVENLLAFLEQTTQKNATALTERVGELRRQNTLTDSERMTHELELFAQHAIDSLDVISLCMQKVSGGKSNNQEIQPPLSKIRSIEAVYAPANPNWTPHSAVPMVKTLMMEDMSAPNPPSHIDMSKANNNRLFPEIMFRSNSFRHTDQSRHPVPPVLAANSTQAQLDPTNLKSKAALKRKQKVLERHKRLVQRLQASGVPMKQIHAILGLKPEHGEQDQAEQHPGEIETQLVPPAHAQHVAQDRKISLDGHALSLTSHNKNHRASTERKMTTLDMGGSRHAAAFPQAPLIGAAATPQSMALGGSRFPGIKMANDVCGFTTRAFNGRGTGPVHNANTHAQSRLHGARGQTTHTRDVTQDNRSRFPALHGPGAGRGTLGLGMNTTHTYMQSRRVPRRYGY